MSSSEVIHDKSIVGSPPLHITMLAVMLFCFWLLLSGNLEPKFLTYGALTAVIAAWFSYPLLLIPNADGTKKYYVFGINPIKLVIYFFWLMWQLVLANIDVIKRTVRPDIKISPYIMKFRYWTDNPMARIVLANSITLTPGTVTADLTDDGIYTIHALADAGMDDGAMQKKVAWLFGEKFEFEILGEED